MSRLASLGLALVVALATLLTAPAAGFAEVRPSPIPLDLATPRPTYLTQPDVDAAQLAVQRARQQLVTEQARLDAARQQATAALQAYQDAKRAATEAAAAVVAAAARSEAATVATAAAREQLRGYADSLYRIGGVDPRLLILTASLSSTEPEQFFNGIDMARQVGVRRGRVFETLAAAEVEQADAVAAAKTAVVQQRAATVRAAGANASAAAAVSSYRRQVAARLAEVASKSHVLADAKSRRAGVERAEAIARARGWTPAPPCTGQDVSRYPNGQIPPDALCPLVYTTTHRLRGDAAYAFNAMAVDYAGTFGRPLCVTDSYRSYDAQVIVAAEKPTLAADPGHSNHGWGLAADLCDGIESFGTPTHQWMVDNAPRFGWFHPDWADPTGSKPEPWHWEFAG
jgi:hypothetical protein